MMMPLPLRGAGRPYKDNAPDELHIAVLTGRCKRIKNLLRKGVHIESVNSNGQTPLFCACWGGDVEVVQLLLGLGANPDRRCGSSGATPVHAAAYRGSRRVLRLLIEASADLSAKDKDNLAPRDYAEKQPHPIRRQKILAFLDLILAMTLHRQRPLDARALTGVPSTPSNTLTRRPLPGFASGNHDSLRLTESRASINKSALSLSKKGLGSMTSVWGACVGVTGLPRDEDENKVNKKDCTDLAPVKEVPSVATLHKSVSCHLVDQLCVTTSLPLLTPADLHRPTQPELAYTCGGPTVYSPHTWLGTPVTVRRPTPAFAITRDPKTGGQPDQDAVVSLLEELSILRRLRHPAFLEVMAACHVTQPGPDHVTLVFQHVPHGSLYHHLHVMHLDLSAAGAVQVLVGVVEGLLFLHAHGWLHCGVSSHALHLVTRTHAKLGGFQHAVQLQAKGGCSMRAEELSRAPWLVPWQAPETLAEAMVSVKSEVYALAAVIWEMWAGMPPWSGVPEEDVKRRVCGGDTLPYLKGAPPSLVMYLTQYGLKWNAHERDLDLHEIHTMLRSLRVQVNEEERVPAVTAWGPPSVPNTPVIGRATQHIEPQLKSAVLSSASNNNSNMQKSPSVTNFSPSTSARISSEYNPLQYLQFVAIDQSMLSGSSSSSSVHAPVSRLAHDGGHSHSLSEFTTPSRKYGSVRPVDEDGNVTTVQLSNTSPPQPPHSQHAAVQVHTPPSQLSPMKNNTELNENVDGPFSQYARTKSSSNNTVSNVKTVPALVTSTPIRHSYNLRPDLQPDLLPSKFLPNNLMQPITPDILTRGKQSNSVLQSSKPRDFTRCYNATTTPTDYKPGSGLTDRITPHSDSEGDATQDFTYISNTAKRAFFTDSEGGSKSPSPTNERSATRVVRRNRASVETERPSKERRSTKIVSYDKQVVKEQISQNHKFEAQDTKGPIRTDVVRRGLSLSNLLNIGSGSMVTRTFSHVSLCSAESSTTSASSGGESRRPQRTISQVTLTFKKLTTADSSSSSSRDELEPSNKAAFDENCKNAPYRRSKSLPKSPQNLKSLRHSPEETAIKPASHQLTRHSSSCSLSSGGPPSPVHQFVGGPGHSLLANTVPSGRHGSLPTSPQRMAGGGSSRPSSMYSIGSAFGSAVSISETSAIKVNPRRYSDGPKPRARRPRRKPEVELEEEFIDDEFNAALYDQPHMQLSVGSSENLLETRLSASSMMADDAGNIWFLL